MGSPDGRFDKPWVLDVVGGAGFLDESGGRWNFVRGHLLVALVG